MANNNKKGNNYQSSISSRRSDKYKANNSSNSKTNTRTSNSSNKNKEQIKHEYVNKSASSNKHTTNHSVAHTSSHSTRTNPKVETKRRKKKLDTNTLIFFSVIALVLIILLLKTMGVLLTALTIVGIGFIILFSRLLKKLRRNKIMRVLINVFTILFLIICIAVVGGVVYFASIIVREAPEWDTNKLNKKETSIYYTADGKVLAEMSTEKRELIPYEDCSENLIDAIVAVEDSRFYQHNGFDPLRFLRASVGQVLHLSNAGGASTLSMQLITTTFTDPLRDSSGMNEEGIKRKFTDIYLAVFKLEKEFSKKEIMEFYVNNHNLGSNAYGVEQAAETYFGKHASELNLAEAATIAGLFQAPTSYNPFLYPEKATERREQVLNLMLTHGYITKEEYSIANSIPIESLLVESTGEVQQYQRYIDLVTDELEKKYSIDPFTSSIQVYTNVNLKKQKGLDDIFDGKTFKWENKKVQSGIAAIDVDTGKIEAIAGYRKEKVQRPQNRATTLTKQIGSTAKPLFDYGPAMEYNGYSTYTTINDTKHYYSSGKEMRNSDRSYMGTITLKTALAQSRNIPALKTFQSVKNENIYNFVTSLGITPETTEGSTYLHEAHSIGAFSTKNGATPLKMAAAYAAFANGGYYCEPYAISKIVYRDTGEEMIFEPKCTRAMSDSTAFMITYCLEYAVTNGLSSGAGIKGLHIAAKTGTTNYSEADAKAFNLPSYAIPDAWIVGYDPDTAVAMWYGYDKISDGYLKSASSGFRVNAQTERNRLYTTAGKALFSSKGKDFKVPDSVVKLPIEIGSPNPGRIASSAAPSGSVTYEYFRKGTEPTEVSTKYSKLSNVKNLKASYDPLTGNVILSWSKASRGNDYDSSYGSVGYKIYRNNTYVGYTTDTSYTISKLSDPTGTYKVVTTYENYGDADSSGATAKIGGDDVGTYSAELNFEANTNNYHVNDQIHSCLIKDQVDSTCVSLFHNGTTINEGYSVKLIIINSNGESVNEIDTTKSGTYKVKFEVTYNGKLRATTKEIDVVINSTE